MFLTLSISAQSKSLHFNNGSTDEYVTLTGTWISTCTIEAWVNLDSSTGDQQTFFRSGSGDLTLNRMSDGSATYTGWSISGGSIPVGAWTHIVFSSDGTTVNLYVNGTLVSSGAYNGENLQDNTLIGNYTSGTSNLAWAGKVDEVRIWSDVRTGAEINANKDVELVENEAGLFAYYNFNGESGTTLTDRTSGGHNGTLSNMESGNWSTDSPGALPVELTSFTVTSVDGGLMLNYFHLN